jgi:hypothetical protein
VSQIWFLWEYPPKRLAPHRGDPGADAEDPMRDNDHTFPEIKIEFATLSQAVLKT